MLWWLAPAALAGSVYVNDVNVDALRNQTFKNVTVSIDANGDVRIQAPGYKIEVVGTPGPAPVQTTQVPASVQASISSATAPANPTGIKTGKWWLVTEDNGSTGHVIEVYINNALVQTVRSGDGQMIVDVGAWMRPGSNDVRIQSSSSGATGGTLYVYLGSGNNDSGTVVLDTPDIQYGLGSSRSGPYSREYTLNAKP